jgi:EmrB/QacA subfamily drug resistance transporter
MISSDARRWWALGALSFAVLAVSLPATVLTVALPTLATDLDASASDLQWFVSAFTLALAAGVLPGGLLGDRFGRKKVLLGALMIYGVGSVLAAYSSSPEAFIAAQAVLGLGAAFVIPLVLSGLTVLFSAAERPRAVGIWAAANFVALPLGPILGGWILSNYWWGWVFLMNLPVIAVALVAVVVLLPESRSVERPPLDVVGVLSSSAGLAILTYGLVKAGQDGWGSSGALGGIIGGALILVGFGFWEYAVGRRRPGRMLVDLSLFGSARFTWGTILAGLGIFAFFGILFAAPQYFQAVLGTDAMGSGVRLLPLLGGMMLGAGAADRIAARIGAKVTVALGFAVLAAALITATTTTTRSGYGLASVWTAVGGLGAGLVLATSASAALSAIAAERSGSASALMQAVQKLGAPLSAAVLGSALNTGYQDHLDLTGLPAAASEAARASVFAGVEVARTLGSPALLTSIRAAFLNGLDLMLWTSAAIALVGAVLALIFLPTRATQVAEPSVEPAESDHELAV